MTIFTTARQNFIKILPPTLSMTNFTTAAPAISQLLDITTFGFFACDVSETLRVGTKRVEYGALDRFIILRLLKLSKSG